MADILNLQTTLDQKRQELARLEAELKHAQRERLQHLASEHGFDSTDDLIRALAEFASPGLRATLGDADASGRALQRSAAPAAGGTRKKRVTVSDALREQIATELRRGALGALEIAAKFDVSASTVNQMKQKLGLTRARGTRP